MHGTGYEIFFINITVEYVPTSVCRYGLPVSVMTVPFADRKVFAMMLTVSVLLAHGYGVFCPIDLVQKNGACTFSGSASPCVVIWPSSLLSSRSALAALPATAFYTTVPMSTGMNGTSQKIRLELLSHGKGTRAQRSSRTCTDAHAESDFKQHNRTQYILITRVVVLDTDHKPGRMSNLCNKAMSSHPCPWLPWPLCEFQGNLLKQL